MRNLQNILIDYLIFEKYDKEYFENILVIPLYEDEMFIKFAICKESNLSDIKAKFKKICKFEEFLENDIKAVLNNLDKKIKLYKYSQQLTSTIQNDNLLQIFFLTLIEFVLKLRASDIHIEQNENEILFRFRIDGKLKTFFIFTKELFPIISSYIKLISNLDITQNRVPLDGRFTLNIKDKDYDFRVSTMPTINMESIVLRVLDKKNLDKKLIDLGYSTELFDMLKNALCLTQGLILIAGPTGSGKTTTMYSILNEIISDDKKIITVEDPVEYKLDFVSQIAVNNKLGLSFEIVLKNILRQDPDVIFIGEIRDKFSLDIALQASLTGHLVIATIHANNSIETISRLIDLKADPYLLSVSLKYIISQRLLLKYCQECNLKGCSKCNFTSFFDRTTIAEILKIDEELSSMIFKKEEIKLIKKYLSDIGFKTLKDDGENKVLNNITSINEVTKAINF